jgi:hypothetical protein
MKIATILSLFFLSSAAFAKNQVALVLDSTMCTKEVCLHGNFKKGTKVLLLSKNHEKTCSAKVGKKIIIDFAPGPFEAVELEGLKSCKQDKKDFYLAVLGRNKGKFEIYKSKEAEKDELNKNDKFLKKNKVFSRAWRREVFHKDGNKDQVAYTIKDYKKLDPVGFAYVTTKKRNLQLIRHQFTDGSNLGILFSFYQGKWSAVSSTFTKHEPFVFSLDGRLFIVSQVTCQMDCGYLDHEVYEFNGRTFKLIYNNADLST